MTRLALAALLIGLAACGDDGGKIIIFDSTPPPMVCDPLTQTGCQAGEKCANRILQTSPSVIVEVACVPDGTVPIDGACKYGTIGEMGYSDCKAGGECISRVCKQICDHQGGTPKCDANHACGTYESFFESNGMTIAGVCDTKCDPLTQELAIGTSTAACGSTDPAMADNGCFTRDLVNYTCSIVPTPALTLTDRMPAYGPPTGGAYVNGCAAGYLPLYYEKTGSMKIICMGLCAPGKSDSVNPALAKGDPSKVAKLPTKAMPEAGDGVCTVDKKGSTEQENCMYMWFWNTDRDGNFLPGPYNDTTGICWAYGQYTVPIGGVQQGWPKCEMLPPAGATADSIYGNANDWPCVPFAEAAPLAAANARRAAKEFRLGARPGPGVRHVLVQD